MMISPCVCVISILHTHAHTLIYILFKLLKNQLQVLSKSTSLAQMPVVLVSPHFFLPPHLPHPFFSLV